MKEVNAFYLSERTARTALGTIVKDGMVLKIISVSMLVQVTKMAGNFPAADEPGSFDQPNRNQQFPTFRMPEIHKTIHQIVFTSYCGI